jgi:sialic acid synthase SpsE
LYKNEKILRDSITCKRPAIGISAENYQKLLGLKVKRNIKKNDPLTWAKIK